MQHVIIWKSPHCTQYQQHFDLNSNNQNMNNSNKANSTVFQTYKSSKSAASALQASHTAGTATICMEQWRWARPSSSMSDLNKPPQAPPRKANYPACKPNRASRQARRAMPRPKPRPLPSHKGHFCRQTHRTSSIQFRR